MVYASCNYNAVMSVATWSCNGKQYLFSAEPVVHQLEWFSHFHYMLCTACSFANASGFDSSPSYVTWSDVHVPVIRIMSDYYCTDPVCTFGMSSFHYCYVHAGRLLWLWRPSECRIFLFHSEVHNYCCALAGYVANVNQDIQQRLPLFLEQK